MKIAKSECDALTCKAVYKGVEFVIAKPQTYINLSGESVKKLVRAYDVDEARELVVCYDDIDLPIGKLRIREEGSAGTHNGMRNIVKELNTEQFARVRIGTKPMNLPITRLNLSILYCQRSILQTSRFCSSQSTLPSKRLK